MIFPLCSKRFYNFYNNLKKLILSDIFWHNIIISNKRGGIIMPEGTKIFTTIVFIFYIIIFSIGLVNVVAPRCIGKNLKVGKLPRNLQELTFW